MTRKNLVWCSLASLESCKPELFGPDRTFDVALHYYTPFHEDGTLLDKCAEKEIAYYWFSPDEKLHAAASLLPKIITRTYEQYAFLDDDVHITTAQLNEIFAAGKQLGLPLYQPSLTVNSLCGWEFLRTRLDLTKPGASYQYVKKPRMIPMVEIMMPFFSRSALEKCLPVFDFNCSGWGMDIYQWPELVDHQTFVLDWLTAGHYATAQRRQRKLASGLTPYQELWINQWIFEPDDRLPATTPPADDCDSLRITIGG